MAAVKATRVAMVNFMIVCLAIYSLVRSLGWVLQLDGEKRHDSNAERSIYYSVSFSAAHLWYDTPEDPGDHLDRQERGNYSD